MNDKTKKSGKQATRGGCLCQGIGPVLSELARRLGPPEPARGHFETARLEILKGLRAMLDARIQHRSKADRKGQKIEVQ